MSKKKRPVHLGLAALMMGQVIPAASVLAETNTTENEDVESIDLTIAQEKNIDVVLTVGDSDFDHTNFKDDLNQRLLAKGINPETINISALKTSTVSTKSTDAKKIFNEWVNFPEGRDDWKLDEELKAIYTNFNSPFETGFYDPTSFNSANFVQNAQIKSEDPKQPMGFIFRLHQNEDDPTRWNAYFLWLSTDAYVGPNKTAVALFKVEGHTLGEPGVGNTPSLSGTYAATPLTRFEGNKFGWPYHKPFDHGGFPNATPMERGYQVTNLVDPQLKTTVVDFGETAYMGSKTWNDLTLEVKGNKIQASLNGTKVIDIEDTDNPYTKGYNGVFSYSHMGPYFKDFTVTKEETQNFAETIRTPKWRNSAEKFIVNVENNNLPEFEDPSDSGEILSRLMNEDINYVAFGSDENKEQAVDLIERNNKNGAFINTNEYESSLDSLANYILAELNKDKKVVTKENPYVLTDSPIKFETNIDTDGTTDAFPNGRWKINHNAEYFENSEGISTLSGKARTALPATLDKAGAYQLFFEGKKTNPEYILAHRRPVAAFSMKADVVEGGVAVTTEDNSYDPDRESNSGKGIVERKWLWRETSSQEWNEGALPNVLPEGNNYLVQLQVKDQEGTWSLPFTTFVTTDVMIETVPIAHFAVSEKMDINQDLVVNDSSYDPGGKAITNREWSVLKEGVQVYSGNEMIPNFIPYGEGNYTIQLTVTSEANVKSETFSRNVQVVDYSFEQATDKIEQLKEAVEQADTFEEVELVKELIVEAEKLVEKVYEPKNKENLKKQLDQLKKQINYIEKQLIAEEKINEAIKNSDKLNSQDRIDDTSALIDGAFDLIMELPEGEVRDSLTTKLEGIRETVGLAQENLIQAELLENGTIRLKWTEYDDSNSYRVTIKQLDPVTSEFKEVSFKRAANEENLDINNLASGGETYLFEVYPRFNGVQMTENPMGTVQLYIPFPDEEEIPVIENIKVTTSGTTSAKVTWDEFEDAVRYRVQTLVKDPLTGTFVAEGFSKSTTKPSIEMNGLKIGRSYKFEITPNTSTYIEESKAMSEEITIVEEEEEKPSQSTNLSVQIQGNVAELSWEPFSDTDKYRVQLYVRDKETNLFVRSGAARAISGTSYQVVNLRDTEEYKFEVTPRIGYVYDTNQSITATTGPNVPVAQ